jgi:hypothetical protein
MKKIVIVCLMAVAAFQMKAQTLEEVINKNIEARGGKEALAKLKTMAIESEVDAGGQKIPMKTYLAHNKGFRMEVTAMGMDNYMVVNTKEGASFFPIQGQKGPEAMPAEMVASIQSEFDLAGEFIGWKEKGLKLELQGEEEVEGTMCFKILCVYPNKKEKRFFIDKESYQIIRENEKFEVNGKEMDVNQDYGNFKKVDGYTLPFSSSGQMGAMKILKYTINSELKDTLFQVAKK